MYRSALNLARPLARAHLARPVAPTAATRSFANATVRLAGKPAEEQSAQHPGKSGLPHLENPSLSEEAVHADRLGQDPLKGSTGGSTTSTADAAAAAENVVDQVKDAANSVAQKVKDAANTITGAGNPQKRSYHSTAVRRENPEGSKPVEEQSAQHPGKSGHDHLENPSMSEETVHADRTSKDPLPGDKKPSRQNNSGDKQKTNVSSSPGQGGTAAFAEPAGKPGGNDTRIEDLPDGEATKKSAESASLCSRSLPDSLLSAALPRLAVLSVALRPQSLTRSLAVARTGLIETNRTRETSLEEGNGSSTPQHWSK